MKAKKFLLTFTDRLVLPPLLPKTGSFSDLIVGDDILKKLQVSQDELVEYKIKITPDGRTQWDLDTTPETFEYTFTDLETTLITDMLQKLNEEKKLHKDHLNLYKIFVDTK